MNVPYVVPEDEVTPYPADFERVVQAVREMGYALDVIEKGRAAGAIFDDVPFLVSFDTSGRFLSIRALWESDLPAESAEPALFATADNWNREKYFQRCTRRPLRRRRSACTRISWWTRRPDCRTCSCVTRFRRVFRRVLRRSST